MAETKRKPGRPSRYTQPLGERICQRIVSGESLRSICRDPKMPGLRTVCTWIVDDVHTEFQQRYTRARQAQAELLADDITEISDDSRNDWVEEYDKDGACVGYKLNGDHVQRSKLRVESRKWIAARLLHRYADKQHHEHSGPGGGPIEQRTTIDATGLSDAALSEIMEAQRDRRS